MNTAIIYGKVVKPPRYKRRRAKEGQRDEDRTTTLDLLVAVQRPREGSGVDFVPVRCWNKTADELKDNVVEGDHVIVQGRLQTTRETFHLSAHDVLITYTSLEAR